MLLQWDTTDRREGEHKVDAHKSGGQQGGCAYEQWQQEQLLGILILLSNYMHILNSSFSILTYYSKPMFYYYFLPTYVQKCYVKENFQKYLLDKH
jgi:hypothetical protein